MLKSNSKVFQQKVDSYLLSCVEDIDDQNRTPKECIIDFIEQVKRVENVKSATKAATISYLWGLPNYIHFEYVIYSQRQSLKTWYEQTEQQADKYSDNQVVETFMSLLYDALVRFCKLYEVKL